MKLRRISSACLLGLVTFSGCGDGKMDASKERLKSMAGGQLKDVVAIKGVVQVDGSPAAGVNLFLYREGNANPTSECRTDEEGKYCWSTYLPCDGLEPGSYLLGFTYIPKPRKNDTGVDLFKGKYKNAQKNKMELIVKEETPQEDVNYELTTK